MPGEPDQIYVDARRALLDALDALGPQAAAIVLVGAQAIYLHTGVVPLMDDDTIAQGSTALAQDLLEALT